MLSYKLLQFILEGHMFLFFRRGRVSAGAAQSVKALYFQHKGTHCHVTAAGWSRPNSIRITEIPQNTSVLELQLVPATHTCLF